jgi:probable O-glycosylation ligase (exosortase A-associated)
MFAATLFGTIGCFTISPFCGVFVYYLYAVLRPQFLWKWALNEDFPFWSFYVAVATILAAVCCVCGLLPVTRSTGPEGPRRMQWTSAHSWLVVFGVWIGITTATAQHVDVAFIWFQEYLKIFGMYIVAAYLIRTAQQVWALFVMIGVSLAYISYEINYQYFVDHYLGIYHNGYGGLDNNGAGLMLAMGVPICWFCYEGLQSRWRWFFAIQIPIIVHAVLMTYSRGAMLSLLVMCPLLFLRSRRRGLLALAFGVFAVVLVPVMAGPEISARFLTLKDNEVDESANSRRQSWAAAWRMANDYPVFGVGVRNANLFSHLYGADMEGRTIHSQYFQIAADNGMVGLALYLAVLGAGWISLRRARLRVSQQTDPESRRIEAIASGVQCSLALYCFGSAFLSLEVFELPYLLLLLAAQLDAVTRPDLNLHSDSVSDPQLPPAAPAQQPLPTTHGTAFEPVATHPH